MANFPPLKNYIFYCLDSLIAQYGLIGPFLDFGCGNGDVAEYLATRGWHGKAIDISQDAVQVAKQRLSKHDNVIVQNKSVIEENGSFCSILAFDVLEHIEDDQAVLKKIYSLLNDGGYLVLTLPSNPREWRWDDDFYGHVRRYTTEQIREKLLAVGLEPIILWDFTYPVFWLMRRMYTFLKRPPKNSSEGKLTRTMISSCRNSWDIPLLSWLLSKNFIVWKLIYRISFRFYRHHLHKGHEMMVLAQKCDERK